MRWRPGAERFPLPEAAWETIRDYLAETGRLSGMRAESYVFAPLAYPGREEIGGRAEDWREGKCVAYITLLARLKLFGRAAGIAEEKLTLLALWNTAARLRLEAGEGLDAMRTFLDSRERRKTRKYRLGRLPEMPEDRTADGRPRRRGATCRTAGVNRKNLEMGSGTGFMPRNCQKRRCRR